MLMFMIFMMMLILAPRWAINYKPGDIPKPATGKRPARRCVAGCNLIDLDRAEIMTDLDYSASL